MGFGDAIAKLTLFQTQGSLLVAPNWMVVCPRSFESKELSESISLREQESKKRGERKCGPDIFQHHPGETG